MVDVVGETAHEVVTKSIDWVMENGEQVEVWGGTIPDEFGEDESPNDFKRDMVEWQGGFSYRLENPRKRWSTWSNHWTGITLRETEDDICGLNPGMTPEYSRVYQEWIEDNGYIPHTYGQRMRQFGRNPTQDTSLPGASLPGANEDNRPFIDQWESVRSMLEKNPTTRKACMSFWDPHVDSRQIHSETNAYVPCNIFFQLTIRDGKLHWHTMSRSKDILRGSTENLFEFPLLQEVMANQLNVELGHYTEHVTNVHIYQEQIDDGYLEQDVEDPYENGYPEDEFWDDPFKLTDRFEWIDDCLIKGKYDQMQSQIQEIDDVYWRQWKQALAAEWIRMNEGPEDVWRELTEDLEFAFETGVRDFSG